ncbi:hypothetical protein [Brockia lithotrophica]|uniref:hypothetical protein n=1 Tax=Brockia lithotrophica TaxID=933949 RepID=UPI0011C3BE44|nr:hypothetical protein [Brockia lithotrophica]
MGARSEGCEADRKKIAEAWIAWFQGLAALFREASREAARLTEALHAYALAEAESALRALSELEGRLLAHAREGEALREASQKAFAREGPASPSTYAKLLFSAGGEERRLAEILEDRIRAATEAAREFARARARLQGVAEAGIREAELARALLVPRVFGAPPAGEGRLPPRVFDGRA